MYKKKTLNEEALSICYSMFNSQLQNMITEFLSLSGNEVPYVAKIKTILPATNR